MSVTAPELERTDTGNGDDYAHYARREDILAANVNGGKVKALCGFEFEPIRDPSRFPVCPACKQLAELLDN